MTRKRTWRDYWRAFSGALRMTLRGEILQPVPVRYPILQTWIDRGSQLVNAAFAAADAAGLDEAQRKTIMLHLEGRDISMQVILAAVQFNLMTEYPMLMRERLEHHLLALYALNMEDQFRVQRLAEAFHQAAAVQAAIESLSRHLQAIPSSQVVQQGNTH